MCSILAGGLRYNIYYATSVILSLSLDSSTEFKFRADTKRSTVSEFCFVVP